VIAARRLQRTFADGLIAEAVEDLWEPWMRYADQALEDEALLLIIQQELAKRYKKSKTRGRPATTAEVVLRMMLLKHARDWSYADLTREVRLYKETHKVCQGLFERHHIPIREMHGKDFGAIDAQFGYG
jgi:IS5 family transposase